MYLERETQHSSVASSQHRVPLGGSLGSGLAGLVSYFLVINIALTSVAIHSGKARPWTVSVTLYISSEMKV